MVSDLALVRRKICQAIARYQKIPGKKSQYMKGYIDALCRVEMLIDKINKSRDDYDQHRHSGLLEED